MEMSPASVECMEGGGTGKCACMPPCSACYLYTSFSQPPVTPPSGGVATVHRANEHTRTAPHRLLPRPAGKSEPGGAFGGQQGIYI